MFINSEHQVLSLNWTIENLKKEVISLTKERDLLIQWNEELLKWKTEVNNTTEKTKQELYTLESILTETKKTLAKQQIDFISLTDKQQSNIELFNSSIQKRLSELSRLEWIELIDFETENRKLKAKLNAAREELVRTQNDTRIMNNVELDLYDIIRKNLNDLDLFLIMITW
jgi:hypothetical protein